MFVLQIPEKPFLVPTLKSTLQIKRNFCHKTFLVYSIGRSEIRYQEQSLYQHDHPITKKSEDASNIMNI